MGPFNLTHPHPNIPSEPHLMPSDQHALLRSSACIHCGTEFSPSHEGENFCCKGCEFVHALIRDEGLERFYDLQDGAVGQPIRDRPFRPAELPWLDDLVAQAAGAETDATPSAALTLRVRGISCVGCVWLIEKLFLRHDGAIRADVFPSSGKLVLTWQPGVLSLHAFAGELQRFGYGLEPWKENAEEDDERRTLISRLGLCGAFALNSMVFTLPRYLGMGDDFALARIFGLITLLSATFTLLIGGSYFIRRAWSALRLGVLHIDLPIALGILLAYSGSLAGWALGAERLLYFDFVSIFTFLMLAGRYLHISASEKVRHQLRGQAPVPATLTLDDGSELPLEEVAPGTRFQLPSGAVLPVTAILEDPAADFSLAWMTGEPEPVTLAARRRVAAGAVSLNREPIHLQATQSWSDSLVSTLAARSESSGRSKSLEAILRIYLVVVLVLGLAGGLAWGFGSHDAVRGLQVAIAIFVVSCPCALGIAIPLADQRASAWLQRLGVFVQNPGLWSRLRQVRILLLDKTGTLTLEHPQLDNPETLGALDEERRQTLATLAAGSLHPLSRTLLEALGSPPQDTTGLEELPGLGIRFRHDHSLWSLGRPGWSGRDGEQDQPPEHTDALSCDFRHDGELLARFAFSETARPDAAKALDTLSRHFGLTPHILSGDAPGRVRDQARELGLDPDDAHGGLSPGDKEALVRRLDRHDSLYLGDGANDSLAFDAAFTSGTPAAERSILDRKADFFFTARGLGFLPRLFHMSRWRSRCVLQIFTFAILYNIAAIGLCLAGLMNPLLAAILMPLSSLACLSLAARPQPAITPAK
jgi:Cu2+-exporting ATPase